LLQQIASGRVDAMELLGDGGFPLIARPVGSHAGQGLLKLDNQAAAAAYLEQHAEQEFYIARFVDYSGNDGMFRKYRIVLIEGKPFICHMAVSEHWMVHYLNAGMGSSADKRAQEEQEMEGFDRGFAQRHHKALKAISDKFGLEYVGIDCAETRDGKLMVFEIDTSIIVHAMDPVDVYPYKQAAMQKVFVAFRALLQHAADTKNSR
jgi:glutathione synthase/RimK-type ligase-like ATP-grasp enzyme